MNRLWKEFNSQLRYQIIFPFLLLTLIVAMAGGMVVFYLVGQSLQERFDNHLAAVTRAANDALVSQEQANLQFLREVAFSLPNETNGAPAVLMPWPMVTWRACLWPSTRFSALAPGATRCISIA